MNEIMMLAQEKNQIDVEAYRAYKPIIDDLLSRVVPEKELEYIMDRFVSFCGYDENLSLFNELCETYQSIYPEAIDFQRQQLQEFYE